MQALPLVEPENAAGATAALLALAQQLCGVTPNLIKALANSPAALRGFVDLAEATHTSELSEADRARIALLVAQENRCDYGLSAHSFLAAKVSGLTAEQAAAARAATAADPTSAALLAFTAAVVRRRGAVTDTEWAAARSALTPAEIVAAIAQVTQNLFGNYLAVAVRLDNDWPLVRHDADALV
ncbi:carboxymuconolactone decarboxylase family protein [Nocardia sp. NPDC048505]|uniref:carboxymuconolactone decarboxylase family protein n=1 Tax=unclassified Nocardia TaxID=2637762 RepID=UPI003403B80B